MPYPDRDGANIGVGPILAALGAGVASALSPYAARGIGTAANVLGQFGESRERKAREQRVSEAIAEERRRREEIRTETDRLIDERTGFGPPFRPDIHDLTLDEARFAKVLNLDDTGNALRHVGSQLQRRADEQRQPPDEEIPAITAGLPRGAQLDVSSRSGRKYELRGEPLPREPLDTSRAFEDALALRAEGEEVDHPRVRNLSPARAGHILGKLQEVRHAPRSRPTAAPRYNSSAFLDRLSERAEGITTGDPTVDKYAPELARRILEGRRSAGRRGAPGGVVSGGRTSLGAAPAQDDPRAAGKEFLRRIRVQP